MNAYIPMPSKAPHRAGLLTIGLVLLGANLACGLYTIRLTSHQARIKHDSAQVNSVRYGLFSMDIWRGHFENIVSKSIVNLKLSPQDEATLKSEIEKVVRVMIAHADTIMTKHQKTLGGQVRKVAYKALIDVPKLAKKSPQFAQAVMEEITKPESLKLLSHLALSQLNKYAVDTRNEDEEGGSLTQVLSTYHAADIEEFNGLVGPRMESLRGQIRHAMVFMITSVVAALGLWWFYRGEPALHPLLFRVSSGLAGIVLFTSLSVPMLDIDARIKSVDLLLLGEPIHFANQVLYSRSKSILDVIHTLFTSGKADALLVGFLIFVFCVVFPLAKLISTMLCLSNQPRYRQNKWIQFFAFESGKWSMADVMVVAILMAYMGVNNILNHQLNGLNVNAESWQMISTNETSLQPGFILFVIFVLYGLALSVILKRILSQRVSRRLQVVSLTG